MSSWLFVRRKISNVLTMNYEPITNNQSGFSPILIVGLLAAGIIGGTLLIQNGTNFLPQAVNDCSSIEIELSECPSIGTPEECNEVQNRLDSCRETAASEPNPENNPDQNNSDQEALHPIDSQKMSSCGSDTNCKNALCAADEVTYCDNRSGSPRAIRKTGGYYDPNHSLKDAHGCVFDFFEVSSKNSECAKSDSRSGDVVYTTEEEAERLDNEREKTSLERDRAAGLYKDTTFCSQDASKTYNDAKVANNLARFYAIKNGAGGLCVPADLGVPHKDEVEVNGVKGRLMMCSSKANPPEVYWMIASYKDNSLISVPESIKSKPDINNLQFPNLQKAKCTAGLDSGEVCKEG